MFSCEFCEIFKNTFFTQPVRVTASECLIVAFKNMKIFCDWLDYICHASSANKKNNKKIYMWNSRMSCNASSLCDAPVLYGFRKRFQITTHSYLHPIPNWNLWRCNKIPRSNCPYIFEKWRYLFFWLVSWYRA